MKTLPLAITIALVTVAGASANLLSNGDFENGSFVANAGQGGDDLLPGSTAITGWTTTGTHEIAWLPSGAFGVTSESGSRLLDLTGYGDVSPYGGVSQTLSLAAGSYTLTFWLGEDQANALYRGPVSVSVSAGNQSNVIFTNSATGTGNIWQLETLNFTAAGGSTTVNISGASATGGQYIGLDNVDLEAAGVSVVPEPGTAVGGLAALLVGLSGGLRAVRARSPKKNR